MAGAGDVLNVARSLIGIAEDPDGSNRTPIGEWYGMNGVPWCAETVSYCFGHVGMDGIHYAYCPYGINWFQDGSFGSWIDRGGDAQAGDVVFYDWQGDGVSDHTGLVESVRGDGTLVTIEGNVGNACKRLVRSRNQVVGFGRPNYDGVVVNPPAPGPGTDHPTLQVGSRGQAVVDLQTILRDKAGQNIAVDGSFGPATKQAVINLQAWSHITADGIVGPQTWGVLDSLNAPAPPAPPADTHPVLSKGSKGDAVAELQNKLNRLDDAGLAEDGDFGNNTLTAVINFQRFFGLDADGVVGPQTWGALDSLLAQTGK